MNPAANSRYAGTEVRTYRTAGGEDVRYLGRRIIPELDRYRVLDRHRTLAAERIDQVADAYYGDSEQYWRICDANGSERPAEACEPVGSLLLIPLPLEMTGGNT
jgi:hypothetical protein